MFQYYTCREPPRCIRVVSLQDVPHRDCNRLEWSAGSAEVPDSNTLARFHFNVNQCNMLLVCPDRKDYSVYPVKGHSELARPLTHRCRSAVLANAFVRVDREDEPVACEVTFPKSESRVYQGKERINDLGWGKDVTHIGGSCSNCN